MPRPLVVVALWVLLASPLAAQDSPPAVPVPEELLTVEELTKEVSKSVVVVRFSGRNGKQQGLGSGFVISEDGLIATNLHVIGEARPISVKFADGREFDVTEVHASQPSLDLAVVKIDAKQLVPLELGDSDQLKQGESVVALGNPRGLEHSVVAGIVSGTREIEGKPMLQLAIPIEQGNSGGPVLDRYGRVHGIVTLKSMVTENLGFAVAINALKPMLETPNPIPISRWMTIGALDPRDWKPLHGSHWSRRAGHIHVSGRGAGFGGRSLCLALRELPELPYEVATWVRLEREDGAAGLVFFSDGDDKHYGFYPSNEQLRISRFDGPDVFSWRVLQETRSRHYRPGEWNHLKVRIEEDRTRFFVNDHLIGESRDKQYVTGHVGLAKFRDTTATFKQFTVAREIPPIHPPEAEIERIVQLAQPLDTNRPPRESVIEKLTPESALGTRALRQRARQLEEQAEHLRVLASAVHERSILDELTQLVAGKEQPIDLLKAGLLIAKLDNEELDIPAYLRRVERMVADVQKLIPAEADDAARLAQLDRYLFKEVGFHGSRTNYYNRSNSYLNEVLDDREGLPISLSVIYMELARRLGLNVVGVGLPGHFVVRHDPVEGEPVLIDVFDRGKRLTREDAVRIVQTSAGRRFREEHLIATSPGAIVERMLLNLVSRAREERDAESMLRYVNLIVGVNPEDHEQRFFRGVLRFQTGRLDEALDDADWLLMLDSPDLDQNRIRDFRSVVLETQRRLGDQ